MSSKNRDDFPKPTIEHLAKRAGQCCSNPFCRKTTSGPNSSPEKASIIGVAAHITAAAKRGKRYDPGLSKESRSSINNGIWLCENCAKLIDTDEIKYSKETLLKWKAEHDNYIREQMAGNPEEVLDFNNLISNPRLLKSAFSMEKPNNQFLVSISTSHDNLPIYSHMSTSSCDAVSISFQITNRSPVLVEYLKVHAWVLYGTASRAPEFRDTSPWTPQDLEHLPKELDIFKQSLYFNRYSLSLSPHDQFYLMPSQYPYYLPGFEINWMRFIGMLPIPWEIEIPQFKPITGVLLLWVSERGILSSETVSLNTDWNKIAKREASIRRKHKAGKSEMRFSGLL